MKTHNINNLAGKCSVSPTRESHRFETVHNGIALCIAIVATACAAEANVITTVGPDPFTGPPFYTDTGRLADGSPYFFHDDEWAAFVFVRLPSCVPPDFNLLDSFDSTPAFPDGPPRVLLCDLTVTGHAIWLTGPPPGGEDEPVQVVRETQ
jgi:hypothetical protein